ncbi:MAG TPA: hypothetical protein VL240_10560 [Candidatus Binatia bacterium]|nr:hypothetical protein [Candidatus Binatia bacterium]
MPTAAGVAVARSEHAKLIAKKEPVTPSWVGRVPQLKLGTYADGMPIHQVQYLCCKLILRPNKFFSRQSLFDFGKVMLEPAKEHGVKYSVAGFDSEPIKIREVLFIDTEDFRLYNNAFILRRRIPYKDGFPIGDPEIVFKFRHPDMQTAAETDVRPHILGDHRVKFKCQAMPLKEKLGGIRLLFSHNVQFLRSAIGMGKENVRDMDALVDLLPVLNRVRKTPKEEIKLVSNTIIEEVLQDIGLLDFGEGIRCKANVAIWRTRGEHRPLIGEFAFQFRFQDRAMLGKEALKRAEAFFIALQYSAEDYIALNCTKTATVYRLLGNPPKSHE